VTVLTGAGASAASGVPTYRGGGGLWRQRRAQDLATPQAFAAAPELVWEWYAERRAALAACAPNAGHRVLAEWSRRMPGFTLLTQNVDGLHEAAGTERVVRLHGSIWELRCWADCPESPSRWPEPAVPMSVLPPRCPACGEIARPGVVWFGEALEGAVLEAACAATDCEVFLAVGTSAVVQPAASLVLQAARRGAFTAEINPAATPNSARVDRVFAEPAERILAALEERLQAIA